MIEQPCPTCNQPQLNSNQLRARLADAIWPLWFREVEISIKGNMFPNLKVSCLGLTKQLK